MLRRAAVYRQGCASGRSDVSNFSSTEFATSRRLDPHSYQASPFKLNRGLTDSPPGCFRHTIFDGIASRPTTRGHAKIFEHFPEFEVDAHRSNNRRKRRTCRLVAASITLTSLVRCSFNAFSCFIAVTRCVQRTIVYVIVLKRRALACSRTRGLHLSIWK
jgi:hypothetical protein